MLSSAWAEDRSDPVILEEERGLEAQELRAEMAVAIAEAVEENIIIRTKRGAEFEFSLKPQTPEHERMHGHLTDEQEIRFQENRIANLQRAATILDKSELAIGVGNLVHEKWVMVKNKYRYWKNPYEELAENFLPKSRRNPRSIRQRGIDLIEGVLRSLDDYFWSRAPVVAEQNEFSVETSVHPGLISDSQNRSTNGGILGLGISLAYNRAENLTAFEVFVMNEKAESLSTEIRYRGFALLPIISLRAGLGLKNTRGETNPTISHHGTMKYPFIYPFYFFNSNNEVRAGVEYFSLPPIYSSAFEYKTRASDKSLLRLTFSRQKRGFIRAQFGVPSKIKSLCSRLFTRQN